MLTNNPFTLIYVFNASAVFASRFTVLVVPLVSLDQREHGDVPGGIPPPLSPLLCWLRDEAWTW
jgi:hypothetical protein